MDYRVLMIFWVEVLGQPFMDMEAVIGGALIVILPIMRLIQWLDQQD